MRRLLLVLLATALALAVAGCGGGGGNGATEAATTSTAATGGRGDTAAGKEVFASAGCGGCHTFSAAGASGNVGPNLDDASPSFDKVVSQVTNGGGAMPSFENDLTTQQIRDLAAFVSGS